MDSDDTSQDLPYERIRQDLHRRHHAIGRVASADLQQQQQTQQKHGPNQDQDQLSSVPMDSCDGGKPTGSRVRQKIEFVRTAGVLELMDAAPVPYDISTTTTTTTTTLAPQPNLNSTNPSNNTSQPESLDSPQLQAYDIKSIFECPICFDFAVPPICQCQNGHIVCQPCSSKINHCPTCRVAIAEPHIRNLQLDKLAGRFQFPCKYNFNGCKWKSYYFKKREHEDLCDFISYTCPCPGTSCKWTGLLHQVMPHLNEQHKSITTLSGEDIVFLATDINLKGAVDWVMIQSCFNQHFLLVLEKQELKTGQQQFFAIVQLIGSPKDAERFKYKLELNGNSSGHSRRLQWEAVPRSILDGVQFAISNYDCLVFDSKMAQHFLSPIKRDKVDPSATDNNTSQSENLGINVTIERVL